MSEVKVCGKCGKKAVFEGNDFMSNSGVYTICLNCGWLVQADYVDDEELINYRDLYADEIDFNKLVLDVIE